MVHEIGSGPDLRVNTIFLKCGLDLGSALSSRRIYTCLTQMNIWLKFNVIRERVKEIQSGHRIQG